MIIALTIVAILLFVLAVVLSFADYEMMQVSIVLTLFAIFLLLLAILIKINPFW